MITYNDGQLPDIDKTLPASRAFTLRILYFAFRHDLGGLSFGTWVEQMLAIENNSELAPEQTVEIVQVVMDARSPGRQSSNDNLI